MPKKILAVDDDPDILLIVRTALESEGFDVRTAGNGPDGLELAKAEAPDLFLLDMMMPGMSGFDVVTAVKDDPALAAIPIIMLTGVSERKKIQEAINQGVTYYIVKPFEFEDLIAKVNTALQGGVF